MSKPVMLPDGRWFDAEQAEHWQHSDTDDSESGIGREVLWITRMRVFVLERWSSPRFPDDKESLIDRSYITEREALSWFLTRGVDVPEPLAQLRDELET